MDVDLPVVERAVPAHASHNQPVIADFDQQHSTVQQDTEQLPPIPQVEEITEQDSSSFEVRDDTSGGSTPRQKRKRVDSPRDSVRKRTKNTSQWICTQRKKAKNTGQGFITLNGKVIKPAQMRPPCSCSKSCFLKFSEDQRKKIFDGYWAIGDHGKHWDYITRHSRSTPTKKKTTGENSRRAVSRIYFFINEKTEEVVVCKYFFMATLGIWDGCIQSAYGHVTSGKTEALSPDKRGKHSTRPHKTSQEKINTICQHINIYHRIPSHYTRARSKREYLENGLSTEKMARHYETWCEKEKIDKSARASRRQYREVFNTNFNLSFFKPKKDLCSICHTIKTATRQEKEILKAKYAIHIRNKTVSRQERKRNKEAATANRNIFYYCFDLEKVLQCPRSDTSDFYYESKLSVYNFTFFNSVNKCGFCYVWHERIAKRGANDMASCLLSFIETNVAEGLKDLRSFSDSCSGQNRNRFMFAMLHLAAVRFGIKISHQFMEPGHTQNENDSIHARVELESRGKDIFDFDEWLTLIRTCKVEEPPYIVKEMKQENFFMTLNF